ncbi:DUF2637 domain-containing protein [Streptomyces sp. LP11]|uniref:DUF2637 domain-containing protein n=1 Tax=Streptomyces pyxinicus TaxID=2970331 RepID=A0ABT2B8C1_9ACTN|nr:DUF2637 domain-containing protein [Streptomyces sp. LP11]MCS0604636.1 DUF2637 domain-containing protein [Streptomyces sp. LP11]
MDGTDRLQDEDLSFGPDFHTIDAQWDPAEELARLLSQASATIPGPRPAQGRSSHRKSRRRPREDSGCPHAGQRRIQVAVLVALISVCAVCMLGWSFSYAYVQLRATASSVLPAEVARWWPLTVYGPWLVAALSILRAAVQGRKARRSWGVLLGASVMAVGLCVSHAPHSLISLIIFGIPPVTSLVCFWEIVGQVSSKTAKPRHAASHE